MVNTWILVNIGCIECCVSSAIVGVFTDEARANELAEDLQNRHSWRGHGQNSYEVFPMPSLDVVADEYLEALEEVA